MPHARPDAKVVTTIIAAIAGAAIASAVGAGAVLAASGRSRSAASSLGVALPPDDLPPSRTRSIPGAGEMFFRDQDGPADRPPIVLLHGWVVSADLNWFTNYAALRDTGRVLAPDHRGHGRGARHSAPYRLADVADDVAALIRAEGAGPATVIGYSMGGPIAQLLWQRHPDVVGGLVLCATASHFRFSSLSSLGWRLMALYQVGTRLLPRSWMERALLALASGTLPTRLIGPMPLEAAELSPLLPWVIGEIQRGDAEDIAEAGRELSRFDSRGWIGGVDVPSAVILTTLDRLVPPSAQLELIDLLPDPLVLEVEADHDASAAAIGPFNTALLDAIAHVTTAPAVAGGHR